MAAALPPACECVSLLVLWEARIQDWGTCAPFPRALFCLLAGDRTHSPYHLWTNSFPVPALCSALLLTPPIMTGACWTAWLSFLKISLLWFLCSYYFPEWPVYYGIVWHLFWVLSSLDPLGHAELVRVSVCVLPEADNERRVYWELNRRKHW